MTLYENSIITKLNYNSEGEVVSVKLKETQTLGKRGFVQVSQFPDEYYRMLVKNIETNEILHEVQQNQTLKENQYYVNYTNGLVFFHLSNVGKNFSIEYYGKGVELISTNRLIHKYDVEGEPIQEVLDVLIDERLNRMDDIIETGEEAVENLISTNEEVMASEQERIERFEQMQNYVNDEIADKDSKFQSQLSNQQTDWEAQMEAQQEEFDRQMDGAIFGHFNDKIEQAMDKFDALNQEFKAYDFNKYPLFYKTLQGKMTSVMQTFAKLSDGTWLMTQVGCTDAPPTGESFTLTRLDNNGEMLDYMSVHHGGHGVIQAIETENGIEVYFRADDTLNYELVRIIYKPNTTIDLSASSDFMVLPKPEGNQYYLINIDVENNLVMLSPRASQGKYGDAIIYAFDKYLAGDISEPLATVPNMVADSTMQGLAIRGNMVLVYYGTIGEKCFLRVIQIDTGEYADYHYDKLGYTHNDDKNTVVEAEGCFIDKDGNIYLGVSTGSSGAIRANRIYVITSPKQSTEFISETLENSQTYKYIEGDGHAKWQDPKPQSLSEIKKPGWYYFTSSEFDFDDVPAEYKGVSGFWLNVYPRAKDGTVYQELIRNTSGVNQWRIGRQVASTGASMWKPLNMEKKVLWSGDTRNETTLQLKDELNKYDLLVVRLWHEGGQFTTETITTPIIETNKRMFFHGMNVGDSDGSATFYMFEMVVEVAEDMKTLTQSRKTRLSIANGGTNTREQDNVKIGIHEIVGIRGFVSI